MEIMTAHNHPVLLGLIILSLVLNVATFVALYLIYKKLLPVLKILSDMAPMLQSFGKVMGAGQGMMQKAKDAMRKMGIG